MFFFFFFHYIDFSARFNKIAVFFNCFFFFLGEKGLRTRKRSSERTSWRRSGKLTRWNSGIFSPRRPRRRSTWFLLSQARRMRKTTTTKTTTRRSPTTRNPKRKRYSLLTLSLSLWSSLTCACLVLRTPFLLDSEIQLLVLLFTVYSFPAHVSHFSYWALLSEYLSLLTCSF